MKRQEIKDRVVKIMTVDKESRDSDERLYQMFLYKFCSGRLEEVELDMYRGEKVWVLPLREIFNVPKFTSITRCRQLVQSEGRLLPNSKAVAIKRGISEQAWYLFSQTHKK